MATAAGLVLLQPVQAATLTDQETQALHDAAGAKQRATKERLKTLSSAQIADALRENLSDVTKIIFQKGYGVFVEYTAADGQDRMWFPGNTGVIRGIWGVRDRNGRPTACFHYLKSVNAVTGEFESTECVPPEQTLGESVVIEKRHGDVFNLLSDRIPYRKAPLDVPAWP
ncbi:hypothetical protein [Novosphingobium sp.]|uniref:hypothetical protein n=1 Tax=Novosphingobium sp. TaxID=1874826 RepID=UPI00333ECC10